MSLTLRIVLIVVAALTFLLMMRQIKKDKIKIDDSIFWIVFSIILIVIAVFPQIIEGLAWLLGIDSPANVVFLGVLFLLIIKCFRMTTKISQLNTKIRSLTQHIALKEEEERKQPKDL